MNPESRAVEPVQPTAVWAAGQPLPYLPTVAQAQHMPVPGRDLPTVLVGQDGRPYYGYAPIVYPEVRRIGIDPVAQRLVGIGAAAAGTGWGVGEVVNAIAGATSSVVLVVAGLVAWKLLPSGSRTTVYQRTEITNHNTATGLFGRAASKTTNYQQPTR